MKEFYSVESNKQQVIARNKFDNEILELIENQLRNDEDTLTQSDLQGRVSAIVNEIINYTKAEEK